MVYDQHPMDQRSHIQSTKRVRLHHKTASLWMLYGIPIDFYNTNMIDLLFYNTHRAKASWMTRKLLGEKKLISLSLPCIHETPGKEALRKIPSIINCIIKSCELAVLALAYGCQNSDKIVYFSVYGSPLLRPPFFFFARDCVCLYHE